MGKWDLHLWGIQGILWGGQQGLKSWLSDKGEPQSWPSDKSDPCPRSIDLPDI